VTITYKEYCGGAPPSGRAKRGREESARELRSCRSNAEADRNEAGEVRGAVRVRGGRGRDSKGQPGGRRTLAALLTRSRSLPRCGAYIACAALPAGALEVLTAESLITYKQPPATPLDPL